MAVPPHLINKTVDEFNFLHQRLKFTIELGGKKLNFLDTTVIKNGNKLEFDWFHKPTFSGRFLGYMSVYPISQKRGVITNMMDKVFRISHPKFYEKNLNLIIKTFIKNDYPIEFVFETINNRLKTPIYKKLYKWGLIVSRFLKNARKIK